MTFSKLIFTLLSAALLSACSFHSGSISTSSVPSDAYYEDIAVGVSQTAKIIGIGGTSKDALIFEAKRQLYKSRPLKANEMYVNFTVDFKKTIVFIYSQTKVTVTADIVKSEPHPTGAIYSEAYIKKLNQGVLKTDLFHIGDSVVKKNEDKAVIIAIENAKKVRIAYKTKKGKLKTKKVSINNLYTNKYGYKNLKVGDQINYSDAKGTVTYLGIKKFLYQDESGLTFKAEYEE